MKKTAILIDAEWFRKLLQRFFAPPRGSPPGTPGGLVAGVTADVFYRNGAAVIDGAAEEIFRIFCYDCEPFSKSQQNPIDRSIMRFGPGNANFDARMLFFKELGEKPYIALRRGQVRGRGWEIKESKVEELMKSASSATFKATLAPTDIKFALEQKGVDMRIGMDVATLSIKKLVDRIVLISGDTDLVPAIKLARREGIQVAVTQIGAFRLAPQLIEDSDFLRILTPSP